MNPKESQTWRAYRQLRYPEPGELPWLRTPVLAIVAFAVTVPVIIFMLPAIIALA